jgi:hypothetical protein
VAERLKLLYDQPIRSPAPEGPLLYLYGIVPPDTSEPPAELRGVHGAPVRLLDAGGARSVVSEVAEADFSAEAIDARLKEVEWVGARGAEHERVLTWFVDRGTIIPFSLFSLHRDARALAERLEGMSAEIGAALAGLAGRREWGVRIWADDAALAERADRLSPRLAGLREELEEASPGRRFLLTKKLDKLRADEARRLARERAAAAFDRLRKRAEAAARTPAPSRGGERRLVLDAAFLVPDDGYERFEREVGGVAGELAEAAMDVQFTGPWPPYHFSRLGGHTA